MKANLNPEPTTKCNNISKQKHVLRWLLFHTASKPFCFSPTRKLIPIRIMQMKPVYSGVMNYK